MSEEVIDEAFNQLVLVAGESATGKSASLMNVRNQEEWLYLCTEAGKRLPFRNKFQTFTITDPYQVHEAFDYATNEDTSVKGIALDSLTFAMDMFESQYVLGSANTMAAWGDFAQFFKNLMQQKVPLFGKPTVILAHTLQELDEANSRMISKVPIKGSLKNNGVEAYFSTVVITKKMPLKALEAYKSDLLHITEDDELVGYKHVFQTRITKNTTGERIRSPIGMFTVQQSFIDNDVQQLLDHLNAYYNG